MTTQGFGSIPCDGKAGTLLNALQGLLTAIEAEVQPQTVYVLKSQQILTGWPDFDLSLPRYQETTSLITDGIVNRRVEMCLPGGRIESVFVEVYRPAEESAETGPRASVEVKMDWYCIEHEGVKYHRTEAKRLMQPEREREILSKAIIRAICQVDPMRANTEAMLTMARNNTTKKNTCTVEATIPAPKCSGIATVKNEQALQMARAKVKNILGLDPDNPKNQKTVLDIHDELREQWAREQIGQPTTAPAASGDADGGKESKGTKPAKVVVPANASDCVAWLVGGKLTISYQVGQGHKTTDPIDLRSNKVLLAMLQTAVDMARAGLEDREPATIDLSYEYCWENLVVDGKKHRHGISPEKAYKRNVGRIRSLVIFKDKKKLLEDIHTEKDSCKSNVQFTGGPRTNPKGRESLNEHTSRHAPHTT